MSNNRIYRAKGNRWAREKAQLIGERIAALGTVTPSTVVDDARDPSSPLHDCFTWDDSEAGEKWRLHEARNIINHIVVEEPTTAGNPVEVRAFYHITEVLTDPATTEEVRTLRYVQIDEVKANAEFRAMTIAKAKQELREWRDRYRVYGDVFGAVLRSIDDFDKGEAV